MSLHELKLIFLYADPGAGALLLQMLMAALFGLLFFFKRIKNSIMNLFRRKPMDSADSIQEKK